MKAGWQIKSFEECIEKVTYTGKDFLDSGEYPVVSQEESFINGYWNNQADVFKVHTPVVIFGDHTKVLKYVDFDFVLGADGVKLLCPKAFLLPRFFYYQLQSVNLDSLGYARHYKLLREFGRRQARSTVAQCFFLSCFQSWARAPGNSRKRIRRQGSAHVAWKDWCSASGLPDVG